MTSGGRSVSARPGRRQPSQTGPRCLPDPATGPGTRVGGSSPQRVRSEFLWARFWAPTTTGRRGSLSSVFRNRARQAAAFETRARCRPARVLGQTKRNPRRYSSVALGFMARMLALCSLPRTNPKQRNQYVRRNGPYALYMTAGAGNKLPYGNMPRLLVAWVCSEAVRTQRRELVLGPEPL